jgi:hypothetical protein
MVDTIGAVIVRTTRCRVPVDVVVVGTVGGVVTGDAVGCVVGGAVGSAAGVGMETAV